MIEVARIRVGGSRLLSVAITVWEGADPRAKTSGGAGGRTRGLHGRSGPDNVERGGCIGE